MNLTLTVRFILAALMLGAAAHVIAQSIVKDWIPFGGLRMWFWTHGFPAPGHIIPGFDIDDPSDVGQLRSTGISPWRYRVGYLLTCPFCVGFYPSAALGISFLLWPLATLKVALILDVWAAQRWLSTRSK